MSHKQYVKNGFNFLSVMTSGNVPLKQYCDLQCCAGNGVAVVLKASDKKLYVLGAKAALFPGPAFRYYGMTCKPVKQAEIGPELRKLCRLFEPPYFSIYPRGDKRALADTLITFII